MNKRVLSKNSGDVKTNLLAAVVALVICFVAIPKLTSQWFEGSLPFSPYRSVELSSDEIRQLQETAARLHRKLIIWPTRPQDDAPYVALLSRELDHAVVTNHNDWRFEIAVGQETSDGSKPATCTAGSRPFSNCTLTVANVELWSKDGNKPVFDAIDQVDRRSGSGPAELGSSDQWASSVQYFWSQGRDGSLVFKGWDCEQDIRPREECFRATFLQRYLPSLFGLRRQAAFVNADGGYFRFRGRAARIERRFGTSSGRTLLASAWNALNRQARDVAAPPPVAVEIPTAIAQARSCAELAKEASRWKTDKYLWPSVQAQWGSQSSICSSAAELGIAVAPIEPGSAIEILELVSRAVFELYGSVARWEHPMYESLLSAYVQYGQGDSVKMVDALARYFGSLAGSRADESAASADRWLSTARKLALSPPHESDAAAISALRYQLLDYYSVRQLRGEKLAFVNDWIAAETRIGASRSRAVLEPMRILADILTYAGDPDAGPALERLRSAWLQQPLACASAAEEDPISREEANIGFSLLRLNQLYAYRSGKGAATSVAMADVVDRVKACFGTEHPLTVQAHALQQEIAAGRAPQPL